MTVEKLLPQNIEAEAGVLGSLLIDPGAMAQVAPFLRPEDFYREAHREIYRAALDLFETADPADLLTLTDELTRRGKIEEVGGISYVSSLANQVPTSANVEYYGRIVHRCAVLRRLISYGGQVAAIAYSEPDAEVAIEEAERLLAKLALDGAPARPESLGVIIAAELERIEAAERAKAENGNQLLGVPTGLRDLDRLTGGWQKSDLIILAARPAVGKTSLGLGYARAAAAAGRRVLVFSLEMSKGQLGVRMLSMRSLVDQQRLRQIDLTSDDWDAVSEAAGVLQGLPITIDDTPGASLTYVRSTARLAAMNGGVDLIIIDYLQLMTAHGATDGEGSGGYRRQSNRQEEISEISRGLKGLARELNIPVLALSQLSRAVEGRTDKRPMLSDLRESGAIEQDSDIVMFIYREEVYNPDTDTPNLAELIVAKHRNGPIGTVQMFWQRETATYRDLELRRIEGESAGGSPSTLAAPGTTQTRLSEDGWPTIERPARPRGRLDRLDDDARPDLAPTFGWNGDDDEE